MKTRTLLLLSVASGLAIMLAGAVFLFQLATQDDLETPIALGEPTSVGDMTVTVLGAAESADRLVVDVRLGGADDDDPAVEFRLIASGRPAPLTASTCPATTRDDVVECRIEFDVATADGTSRVLFHERGDERARWVLAGT